MKSVLLIITAVVLIAFSDAYRVEQCILADLMACENIVPDIIDTAPCQVLEVNYASGVNVSLGKELHPTQVKDQPTVSWQAELDVYYTLLMADPDAPSRQNPALREIRHWLVVNIVDAKVDEGLTVYEYIGPRPRAGSGLHRYVLLLFKQDSIIATDMFVPKTSREPRLKTNTRELIEDFGLGQPIAGNFFHAQNDDFLLTRHQTISN